MAAYCELGTDSNQADAGQKKPRQCAAGLVKRETPCRLAPVADRRAPRE
jgi:hypothetical protein